MKEPQALIINEKNAKRCFYKKNEKHYSNFNMYMSGVPIIKKKSMCTKLKKSKSNA